MNNPETAFAPKVTYTEQERLTGQLGAEKILQGAADFKEHGILIFEQAFAPEFISHLHNGYMDKYSGYCKEDLYDEVLPVGNRRMLIPVEVTGVFNEPYLYGNSLILPVMQQILGEKFIMSGFGSILSLPGAEQQHIHRDHPPLFAEQEGNPDILCFAITVAIPLIDMTEETGTTRFYPKSHHMVTKDAQQLPYVEPLVRAGDCVIWDFEVFHGGTPNRSDRVRPLMYFNYTRPWFQDSGNYSRHLPLNMSDEDFQKVPPPLQPLFNWSRPPKPLDISVYPPDAPCPCYSGKPVKECHGKNIS